MNYRGIAGRHKQQGISMFGVLIVMSVAIFIGMFAFKVFPHYMENWTVSEIANEVASRPDLLKQPRSKVYAYINQAYSTNNLWDLKPEDTIKLTKDGKKGYLVTVQYEKRANLFHNIDLVTTFDKTATAGL